MLFPREKILESGRELIMNPHRRQPAAGAVAGLLLGFLAGVFLSPAPEELEHSVQTTWLYAGAGAALGAIALALAGYFGNRRVPRVSLVPVLVFAAITIVPWFPGKTGRLLPVGAAYVNRGFPWEITLAVHLSLTLGATMIVLAIVRVRRNFSRNSTAHINNSHP